MAPNALYAPQIDAAAGAVTQGYNKSMGLLDKYTPQLDQGISYFGNVMNSDPKENPYLDSILGRTRENTMNAVGSQFTAAGRYGSGMNQDVMARALADQENQLRYQDYGQQQSRMDNAAMSQQQLIGNIIGMPQGLAGTYASGTGGLLGRYTQSDGVNKTKGGFGDFMAQMAQMAAAGATASDPRLKVDMTKIDEADDGLGLYTYRYVTDQPDAELRTGVMADEVEKLRPWAMGPERGGFKTVNYGAL